MVQIRYGRAETLFYLLLLNILIDIVGDEVSKGEKVCFQGFGAFTL